MVLQALHEILFHEEPMARLQVGSSFPIDVPLSTYQFSLFQNIDQNIAEAQREGIRPVNFQQLREQFTMDQLLNAVLFDSPPVLPTPGNHWRVISFDDGKNLMDIKHTGTFGNHDTFRLPAFTISQFDILYTGITLLNYEENGKPISLDKINELVYKSGYGTDQFKYPEDIKFIGETIYWADAQGKLVTAQDHPLFTERIQQA